MRYSYTPYSPDKMPAVDAKPQRYSQSLTEIRKEIVEAIEQRDELERHIDRLKSAERALVEGTYEDFKKLTIADACERILKIEGKPLSNRDLLEQLRRHGKRTTHNSVAASVRLEVKRAGGKIVRVSNGVWGLAVWKRS